MTRRILPLLAVATGFWLHAAASRWRDMHLAACARIAELERLLRWEQKQSDEADNLSGDLLRELTELRECVAAPTAPLTPEQRDRLGKKVRDVWVAWAREQPAPKPSWLAPWQALSEPDREVDRRIGEALFMEGLGSAADLLEAAQLLGEHIRKREDAGKFTDPSWAIPIGRVLRAAERLGPPRPDRSPPVSDKPATRLEREEADLRGVEMAVGGVDDE